MSDPHCSQMFLEWTRRDRFSETTVATEQVVIPAINRGPSPRTRASQRPPTNRSKQEERQFVAR
jgi:hypothetical protein